MDVVIRTARRHELDAVGRLTAGVFGGPDLAALGFLPVLRDAAARAAAPLTEVAVAVHLASREVVGSLTLCRFGSPLADVAERGEAEVRMLAVRPAARQTGVGEHLIRDSADRARRYGCARLVLSTETELDSARRLYERIGFRRAPDRDPIRSADAGQLAYILDL